MLCEMEECWEYTFLLFPYSSHHEHYIYNGLYTVCVCVHACVCVCVSVCVLVSTCMYVKVKEKIEHRVVLYC